MCLALTRIRIRFTGGFVGRCRLTCAYTPFPLAHEEVSVARGFEDEDADAYAGVRMRVGHCVGGWRRVRVQRFEDGRMCSLSTAGGWYEWDAIVTHAAEIL